MGCCAPPPGDLPDQGMKPMFRLLHWQAGPLPLAPMGSPRVAHKARTPGSSPSPDTQAAPAGPAARPPTQDGPGHPNLSNLGFPGGSDSKESACNAGDLGSIPGLERSSGEGNGYSLQYSCLENSMDRGDWRATVHRVTKSLTQLSN